MINREFKQIDKVVWETSKHILNSLEAENNNPDLKFFYTPPKSPSQLIFAKLELHMNEDLVARSVQRFCWMLMKVL